MRWALGSRFFPMGTSFAEAARQARELGVERLAVEVPGSLGSGGRQDLRDVGVEACAVVLPSEAGASSEDVVAFEASFEAAVAAAARLRAPVVVVEGGGVGLALDPRLAREDRALLAAIRDGDDPDAAPARELRAGAVEAAVERSARALHGALRAGVPVALRNGGGPADLFGVEETEWLLSDLPELALFFDPARALRASRLGVGAEPAMWADRFASRTRGVFVHGLGGDLSGGAHPEDGASPWRLLAESLPRSVPWVLDVLTRLSAQDAADALRYLDAETRVGGRGG